MPSAPNRQISRRVLGITHDVAKIVASNSPVPSLQSVIGLVGYVKTLRDVAMVRHCDFDAHACRSKTELIVPIEFWYWIVFVSDGSIALIKDPTYPCGTQPWNHRYHVA